MSVRIRCWIKQTLFVLFATIAISNSAGATILVEFTGSVDQFNYGPLTPFSSITGSFMIDDGIDSTGSLGIRDFDGAVDDFSLEIDDTILGMLLFSGQDGVFSQFCSTPPDEAYGPCGTGGHFISVGVGGSNGSVTGSANGFDFASVSFDLRGDDLFDTPYVLANDLLRDGVIDDFSYARMTLNFNGTAFALERSLDTIEFTVVPEPSTALLVTLGLLGLGRSARTRNEF